MVQEIETNHIHHQAYYISGVIRKDIVIILVCNTLVGIIAIWDSARGGNNGIAI